MKRAAEKVAEPRIATAEVMRRLGVGRTTLHRITKSGALGQPITYADSPRARLYYLESDVAAYIKERMKRSTPEVREAIVNEFSIELERGRRGRVR